MGLWLERRRLSAWGAPPGNETLVQGSRAKVGPFYLWADERLRHKVHAINKARKRAPAGRPSGAHYSIGVTIFVCISSAPRARLYSRMLSITPSKYWPNTLVPPIINGPFET